MRAALETDTEHVPRSCPRSRVHSSRVHPRRDRKRSLHLAAKRPRASRLGAQLHPVKNPGVPIVVVSNLTPEPPVAPPSQAVEERDGLKASLAAKNDELAKSKANANALDVSVVQHGASVDRLKVRERSLGSPRKPSALTDGHRASFFFFARFAFFLVRTRLTRFPAKRHPRTHPRLSSPRRTLPAARSWSALSRRTPSSRRRTRRCSHTSRKS